MVDDDLLRALTVALAPEPAEPSLAELAALQRVVARTLAPGSPRVDAGPRRRVLGRKAVAAFVGLGILTTGSGAYAMAGGPLPRPVREVAHALRLPVESVALADARSRLSALRHALGVGGAADVSERLGAAQLALARLTRGERAELEPDASALVNSAAALVTQAPTGNSGAGRSGDTVGERDGPSQDRSASTESHEGAGAGPDDTPHAGQDVGDAGAPDSSPGVPSAPKVPDPSQSDAHDSGGNN